MSRDKNPEKIPPISSKRWKSMIYKNKEALSQSLGEGISKLMKKVNSIEMDAVSMHVIYVRTSVYNHHSYYRIYLFDERLYNGNTDCWVYWEMPSFTSYLKQTFPMGLNPFAPGYKPKEEIMEQKRMQSAEQLHSIMGEMIAGIILPAWKKLPQAVGYPVYFGEYMEKQQLLFLITDDKRSETDA